MMYNLAIVGGGPAGYSAAFEAIRLGMSVILFEERELGGTCLNRGCVPTKFLAYVSETYGHWLANSEMGIFVENLKLDYATASQKKSNIVSELRSGLEQLMIQKKITIISKTAQIIDSRHILCENAVYETENILIATGSVPSKPIVEGALTTDELLELNYIPQSIKIIGGGVSAVEFAHIFNLLGSEVNIYIRGERILRKWDKEIAVSLTHSFKKRGIKIHAKSSTEQMRKKNDTEIILSAVGRTANLNGIQLSLIDQDESGAIVVSELFQTKTSNVYAAGDVISNSPMLAHTAMEQGKMVAQIIAGRHKNKPSAVVQCIYVKPEIASVGMTEMEAKKYGIKLISAKQNLKSNARTLISQSGRSFIKILADSYTHQIIGAQLMCERASDIVDELALAINNNLKIEDLYKNARPHPSYCEALTDVAERLLDKINEF